MAIVQLRQIEIYTKLVSIPYQIQYYSDKMMRSVVDKDRTTLALALDSNQKGGDLTVELPRNIRLKGHFN